MTDFVPGSTIEVDFVGAGLMVIHRTVLEALARNAHRPGRPWFDWKVDLQGIEPAGECLSEDFTFNLRCRRELGLKILVDTSIVARHCGFASAGFGTMTPLETLPMT